MGDGTAISWTDATWNPVRGCSRVSEGCRHCYAETQAARIVRMARTGAKPGTVGVSGYDDLVKRVNGEARWTGEVRMVPEHLADPLRWRKPRRIFVNSMSDLFHEKLTNEQIAAVFGVMAAAPQHTFQVLTKRARRMREWFAWIDREAPHADGLWKTDDDRDPPWDARAFRCWQLTEDAHPGAIRTSTWASEMRDKAHLLAWPLPNVWLGVSVENQDAADERIHELLATSAAVRFLSCEPLIGAVNLEPFLYVPTRCRNCGSTETHYDTNPHNLPPILKENGQPYRCLLGTVITGHPGAIRCSLCTSLDVDEQAPLDWVIAGCESGPGARPCDVSWLRSLRDQCASAGAPFFLKQAVGSRDPDLDDGDFGAVDASTGSKRKAGGVIELPYLDGVPHAAFPKVAT